MNTSHTDACDTRMHMSELCDDCKLELSEEAELLMQLLENKLSENKAEEIMPSTLVNILGILTDIYPVVTSTGARLYDGTSMPVVITALGCVLDNTEDEVIVISLRAAAARLAYSIVKASVSSNIVGVEMFTVGRLIHVGRLDIETSSLLGRAVSSRYGEAQLLKMLEGCRAERKDDATFYVELFANAAGM